YNDPRHSPDGCPYLPAERTRQAHPGSPRSLHPLPLLQLPALRHSPLPLPPNCCQSKPRPFLPAATHTACSSRDNSAPVLLETSAYARRRATLRTALLDARRERPYRLPASC